MIWYFKTIDVQELVRSLVQNKDGTVIPRRLGAQLYLVHTGEGRGRGGGGGGGRY